MTKKKIVVILLNVFFESVNDKVFEKKLEEIKEKNNTTGSVNYLLENLKMDEKLRLNKIFGLIDKETYEIITALKSARNKFAHDLSKYTHSETEEILNSARLEDAIELYEKMMRIPEEDSLLN
ncbi:MAG: hypothetical protein ACOCTT_01635 [archaeon]